MAREDSPRPPESGRSLRNPRRRNRVEAESVKVAPRRKRSKISETTFLPRNDPEEPEEEEVHTNGHLRVVSGRSAGRAVSGSLASGDIDLAVRGPRGTVKRAARADSAKILTQNEHYSVKLLSNAPKELSREGVQFRGSLSTAANLALAVTHEKAYFWDYNGLSSAGMRSVDITFPSSHHEPLPLGALVTSSGSHETGLLLLSASSGKIIYHESIERVTSLGFFSERKEGFEGAITGLFSGEKVIQLVSADPAGFIALLSSGRVAHISLRDAQGKAKITTQFLYAAEQQTGGFFGSFKNIFGAGSWRQAISAVRVRALERGQVQVLGLMEKGELRIWNLDWSGRYDFRASIDFREQLQHELRQMRPAEKQGEVDYMTLLDIAVLDKPQSDKLELVSVASGQPLEALILVRCGSSGMHSYALVQFSLIGNDFSITRILDVHTSSQQASGTQGRLLVPAPGHTALVVLSDAIAVLSLASAALNPEAQFHETSYIEPSPYQDAIYLRSDANLSFTGGDTELSRGLTDSSSIVYVNGAGFARITTHETDSNSDDTAAAVKSKAEQAVFFGFQDGTILDLLRPGHLRSNGDDIEAAALSISNDILHSSSQYFDMPPASVSANLQKRADASLHLAAYLQKLHPTLPRSVKWQLLTNSEKVAAAVKLWSSFERRFRPNAKSTRTGTILHEACELVKQKDHFELLWAPETPDDVVQTFFVTQVQNIDKLLPWARRVLENLRENDLQGSAGLIRLIAEADDIWLSCLRTAYTYRRDNASRFGIHLQVVEHDTGPNPLDLQDVASPWTASDELLKDIVTFIDLTGNAVADIYESSDVESEAEIKKITVDNAALVDMMCQMYLERIAWCRSRGLAKYDTQAQRLEEALETFRSHKTRQLAKLGQAEAGIALADKYRDMKTLTEMLIAESQFLDEAIMEAPKAELPALQQQADAVLNAVNKYFDKFGQDFAEAFFGEGFTSGSGKMLSEQHEWDDHMTQWLRRDPRRAKACWINDVAGEQDFSHAARSLFTASQDESAVWSKSIELSLAKLAMHAHYEEDADLNAAKIQGVDSDVDTAMQVLATQKRFYAHIQSETYTAVDDEAAVEVVMQSLWTHQELLPSWQPIIRAGIATVLAHEALGPEELIDLLTMLEPAQLGIMDRDLERSETFEALQLLAATADKPAEAVTNIVKMIWKRAYVQEPWQEINKSSRTESNEDMQEILESTNIYRAMVHVMNAKLIDPDSILIVMLPKDTEGAGIHIADLSTYIGWDARQGILEDNIALEERLDQLIEEQHIERWAQTILEMAEQATTVTEANGHVVNGEIKQEDADEPTDLTGIEQAPGGFSADSDIEMEG